MRPDPCRCAAYWNFSKSKNVLKDVTTLILDGLRVPSLVFYDILLLEEYNLRLLSVRHCSALSAETVRRVLRYLIRPSRPAGMPKLKGLYIFGSDREIVSQPASWPALDVTQSSGAQLGRLSLDDIGEKAFRRLSGYSDDGWYDGTGQVYQNPIYDTEWEDLLRTSEGIIAFDAVLCRQCPVRLAVQGYKGTARPKISCSQP